MAAPIALREDFDGSALRGLAKKTRDANQIRRLLALAEIYDGASRSDAARLGGAGLQTIRDWVLRVNVKGVVRWRLIDLAQWLWEEYRIRVAKQTLSRQLRAMGFRKLSARPRHRAHNQHAAEAFKKTSPTCWRRSKAGRPRAPR